MIVRGSLAPDTAIIKLAVLDDRPLQFTGPAVVYDSEQDGIEGLKRGEIESNPFLILR